MNVVSVCTDFSSVIYKLGLAPDYTVERGSEFYQELRDYWITSICGDKVYVI